MRPMILTTVFLLTASSAMASSFLSVDGATKTSGNSIETRVCVDCPAAQPKIVNRGYVVPELPFGTQTMIVREINGEQKVVRTEAWLGGSPVVFFSKASPEALAAAGVSTDGIDLGAKTAAVPSPPQTLSTLDTSGFQLRGQ